MANEKLQNALNAQQVRTQKKIEDYNPQDHYDAAKLLGGAGAVSYGTGKALGAVPFLPAKALGLGARGFGMMSGATGAVHLHEAAKGGAAPELTSHALAGAGGAVAGAAKRKMRFGIADFKDTMLNKPMWHYYNKAVDADDKYWEHGEKMRSFNRARGRKGGRPRKMTPSKIRMAMAAMSDRNSRAHIVAKELGITTTTLYDYVNGDGSPKEAAQKILNTDAEKSS